ncbi:MAG: hypothetical protein ACLGH3_04125 [Actinomycetota bacterium]
MPRRNRRDRDPDLEEAEIRPKGLLQAPPGFQARESHSSEKSYRCPYCQKDIPRGQANVVAWRSGEEWGRRHFHTACWRHAARSGRIPL